MNRQKINLFPSIRAKLLSIISLLTGSVCLFIYLFFPNQLEKQAVKALHDKARTTSEMISSSMAAAVLFELETDADTIITSARKDDDLLFIVAAKENGEIFVSSNLKKAEEHRFRTVFENGKELTQTKDILMIKETMILQDNRIGELYLGFSFSRLRSEVNFSRKVIALISVVIFFLAHLLASWLSFIITRPLSMVVDAASRISSGDLTSRADVKTEDEVGRLANSFNLMVEKVASAYKELEEANHHLEDRIADRTRDLEAEVDDHKHTMKELMRERDNAQRYLDVVEVIIVADNTKGIVTLINQKGCLVLGYKEEEILGQAWVDVFLPKEEREAAREKVRLMMSDQREVDEYTENEVITSKGQRKLIAWHNKRMRDQNGKIQGVLRSGEDITKVRALEKQLMHAQKMEAIGTLAGGIAHDFNNILTGIIWCAQLSRDDAPPESSIVGYQEELLKAASRARHLVQQILTFSRQKDVEKGPVDIREVVEEALKLIAATLPSTIQIKDDLEEGIGFVLADPTQLHQIVMNLCTNAYHAMGEKGGDLTVTLKKMRREEHHNQTLEDKNLIRLTISDTGSGMNEQTLERIFDPFFTTKPVNEGTGLGLSVVHGIVTSFGGTISVSSRINIGSNVTIDLPEILKGKETKEEVQNAAPLGSDRVLFVDDEPEISKMAALVLERLGYKTSFYTSPVQALKVFTTAPEKFDVLVTDQIMPEMMGSELVRKIRQIRSDLPIIFITGYSEIINRETVKLWEPSSYLRKPFSPKELVGQIRNILDSRTDS